MESGRVWGVVTGRPAMETRAALCLLLGVVFVGVHAGSALSQEPARAPAAKLDLNTATAEEIARLPGLDQETVKRILAARPFRTLDEIKYAGVSDALYKKLTPLVEAKFPVQPRAVPSNAPKLNLNTATEEELVAVKGIGEATAKKIIAARPLKSVNDLKELGVSEADVEKLAAFVEVKPAGRIGMREEHTGKVDLNTATEAELIEVKGIGPVTAKKIIAARPLKSVNDLKELGLSDTEVEKLADLVTVRSRGGTRDEAAPDHEVDLNAATLEQLVALPAVDEIYAKKILAGRPYKNVSDLSRAGIPEFTIKKIAPLVTVEVPARTPPRPGLVWANAGSKIFHRPGDRWYGKTQEGEWMTEAEARKAGYRPTK
jgi:competence protein ComEA